MAGVSFDKGSFAVGSFSAGSFAFGLLSQIRPIAYLNVEVAGRSSEIIMQRYVSLAAVAQRQCNFEAVRRSIKTRDCQRSFVVTAAVRSGKVKGN